MLMMGAMMFSLVLTGLAFAAQAMGWFWWFVLAEAVVCLCVYYAMKRSLADVSWPSLE
jgi:hypothetical protein